MDPRSRSCVRRLFRLPALFSAPDHAHLPQHQRRIEEARRIIRLARILKMDFLYTRAELLHKRVDVAVDPLVKIRILNDECRTGLEHAQHFLKQRQFIRLTAHLVKDEIAHRAVERFIHKRQLRRVARAEGDVRRHVFQLCVLLALALTLTLVGSAVAEDKVNLTAFQYTLENQSTDFNNLWFFQQIEEKTNTHVDFTMVKDGDFQTQLNLMFISGKYMDMILRGSTDIEDYGVNQGLLMPLDEYITEDIMPNYVSRLNLNNAGDSIPASDGHSYYIGYLIAQNVNHNGTWYINTTLLDQLGLEVPTTIDEYTNVLRKFKEAGIKYPLSTSTFGYGPETIWNEFASFGVPENYAFYHITDDDKVEFTGTMPGWRACVEWLHMLYEEGLLDPECLTQDSNLWANKVNAGEVASFPYLRLINTALTPDVYKDFKSILPPADPTYGAAVSAILEVPDQGAILTSTNANPVASLKWIDAQLETETMMVAANGKVGEQIQLNDEGKYEVINVPENNGLYSFVPVTMGQFFAPGEYYTQIYQMAPHRVERYLDSEMYAAAGVLEHKSYQYVSKLSKMDNEDAVEAANIYTELKKFMEESVTDFIKNGVTDESYNTFVETAKAIGVERYIELYQNAYAAYLAK